MPDLALTAVGRKRCYTLAQEGGLFGRGVTSPREVTTEKNLGPSVGQDLEHPPINPPPPWTLSGRCQLPMAWCGMAYNGVVA